VQIYMKEEWDNLATLPYVETIIVYNGIDTSANTSNDGVNGYGILDYNFNPRPMYTWFAGQIAIPVMGSAPPLAVTATATGVGSKGASGSLTVTAAAGGMAGMNVALCTATAHGVGVVGVKGSGGIPIGATATGSSLIPSAGAGAPIVTATAHGAGTTLVNFSQSFAYGTQMPGWTPPTAYALPFIPSGFTCLLQANAGVEWGTWTANPNNATNGDHGLTTDRVHVEWQIQDISEPGLVDMYVCGNGVAVVTQWVALRLNLQPFGCYAEIIQNAGAVNDVNGTTRSATLSSGGGGLPGYFANGDVYALEYDLLTGVYQGFCNGVLLAGLSWADPSNTVPHGPGNRETGVKIQLAQNNFNSGPGLGNFKAYDLAPPAPPSVLTVLATATGTAAFNAPGAGTLGVSAVIASTTHEIDEDGATPVWTASATGTAQVALSVTGSLSVTATAAGVQAGSVLGSGSLTVNAVVASSDSQTDNDSGSVVVTATATGVGQIAGGSSGTLSATASGSGTGAIVGTGSPVTVAATPGSTGQQMVTAYAPSGNTLDPTHFSGTYGLGVIQTTGVIQEASGPTVNGLYIGGAISSVPMGTPLHSASAVIAGGSGGSHGDGPAVGGDSTFTKCVFALGSNFNGGSGGTGGLYICTRSGGNSVTGFTVQAGNNGIACAAGTLITLKITQVGADWHYDVYLNGNSNTSLTWIDTSGATAGTPGIWTGTAGMMEYALGVFQSAGINQIYASDNLGLPSGGLGVLALALGACTLGVNVGGTSSIAATATGVGSVTGSGACSVSATATGMGLQGVLGGSPVFTATATGSGAISGAGARSAVGTGTGGGSIAGGGASSISATASGTVVANGAAAPIVSATITGVASVIGSAVGTGSLAVTATGAGAGTIAGAGAASITATGLGTVLETGAGASSITATSTGAGSITAGGATSVAATAIGIAAVTSHRPTNINVTIYRSSTR